MFKNYFKTAWRNLLKNKFYGTVNVAGLAIGLAVGIMILFWVQDEMSYDGFHKNAASIYKINSHVGSGADEQVWEGAPAPLAVFSKQSIPEVVNAVRIKPRWDQLLFTVGNKKFPEYSAAFVDSGFFSVFDFKLLKGNSSKPFADNNSVILTASLAKKYFGDEDAFGKLLTANKENYVVTGIMEDFPENSSIRYNVLFPMSLYAKQFTASGGNGEWKTIDEDLGNYFYTIYVQLQKHSSAEDVSKKITNLYWQHRPGENPKNGFFRLQSLKTVHLIAADGNESALQKVKIFLLVAVLILIIACINYVNLTTARSILRSKEVSMRKIIGAAKRQLFVQFIAESAILFVLASLLAFGIVYLCLPLYNSIAGKHLTFSVANANVWRVILCAITGTLLLSSVYPALLLSSFKPVLALKGKFSTNTGNAGLRKVLVVVQFVFSIGLITMTIIVARQLKYMKEKDLGYDKEQVFSFNLRSELYDHFDAVKNELLKQPGVQGIATSNSTVVDISSSTGDTHWEGKEANRTFLIRTNAVDENFIPLLKMKMAAGRNFSGSKADSAHFILNETAVKQAGIEDPVGKSFTLWDIKGTLIGVVKDFNYTSLRQSIEPAIFYYRPVNGKIYIKTNGKEASKAIVAAEKIWKRYSPDFPFTYSFLDEEYDRMYKADERTGNLFTVFAAVAVLISCLGLLGLATYAAQVKTKEIGIRKVLGASVANITGLLAKQLIFLVVLAFIIATPVSWMAMNKWLQNYAYRINISWWVFPITGLLAVAIAFITISFQVIKAALANPVKNLRTE